MKIEIREEREGRVLYLEQDNGDNISIQIYDYYDITRTLAAISAAETWWRDGNE